MILAPTVRIKRQLIPFRGHNCGFGIIRRPRLQWAVSRPETNLLKPVLGSDKVIRVNIGTRTRRATTEDPAAVGEWFGKAIETIWPVADGSLSLRKSPCVRANCPACAAGEGHRSYVLYGRTGKKRFSIYVPEDLVPELRAAMENGRRLKELIGEAGLRYTQALKEQRKRQARKAE
jgi:hypothetical protein